MKINQIMQLCENNPTHYHSKQDENGRPIAINNPTNEDMDDIDNPQKTITFTSHSKLQANTLNGISLNHSHPNVSPDQMFLQIKEPIIEDDYFRLAAGCVVEESDGRVWIVEPTNHFGGYEHTFPKGRVEQGWNTQSTAIKETYEETGLNVKITGFIGDFEGSTTITRYFSAQRIGGDPTQFGWESQSVKLVPRAELGKYLNNSRDKNIVSKLK